MPASRAVPPVPAPPQPWRALFSCLVFLALFALLGWRLHHLQVEEAPRFSALGERQRQRTWIVQAPRGAITDGAGTPLALSTSVWHCYADADYMDDRLGATVALSRVLGLPRDELRRHFESGRNGRCIAKDLSDDVAAEVRSLRLAGIHLRRAYKRSHPHGALAAHVLGFVLDDGRGGGGVEAAFDERLRGRDGRETVLLDALGNPSIDADCERVPAQPGANVQLTIELPVQRAVEEALAEAVERHRPASAAAIVVQPTTGAVLAMASWPSFDPAEFRGADPASFRNNVLSFVYESGSTMKPLVAGAAVADGIVDWQSRVFCENGRWTKRIGRSSRTITDHSLKHGGHQWLTVAQGIAESDNILMAKLGLELGPERLHHWIRLFGFGTLTGIELAGEDAGIMLPRERWNHLGSCMSIPMGHELAVTPLQMAMAHAAVANEGLWLPPRLVRRITSRDPMTGRQQDLPLPQQQGARRIFSAADADRIEEAMRLTMTDGTGRRSQLAGWSSAGKTGTTEKLVDVDVGGRTVKRYSKDRHIGSFVCWAPADPGVPAEALVLVVIDDPRQNGHYGSQTAAPVVQKVLQATMAHLHPGAAEARP